METTIDGKTMDPKERIQDAVMRFMEEYFNVSMANPAALANMYREDSLMIFDGQKIRGKESILAKLTSLQQCRHQVLKIQCLPTGSNDLSSGFTGLVCGCIWPDGKQHARNFSQMFVLLPTPEGSFDISHSIFYTGPESSVTALASSTRPFV